MLALILAGGKGESFILTIHRAKPAVPFGGKYRIIDFTLSNCINSGFEKSVVHAIQVSLIEQASCAWMGASAQSGA